MTIKELKIIIDRLSEEELEGMVVITTEDDNDYSPCGAEYDGDVLSIEL